MIFIGLSELVHADLATETVNNWVTLSAAALIAAQLVETLDHMELVRPVKSLDLLMLILDDEAREES